MVPEAWATHSQSNYSMPATVFYILVLVDRWTKSDALSLLLLHLETLSVTFCRVTNV
jgi:hypothetical protein